MDERPAMQSPHGGGERTLFRDLPDRKLLGVAAALSGYFRVPVALLRLGFFLLIFVHLLGPIIYLAAWAFIPFRRGESPFGDRVILGARGFLEGLKGGPGPAARGDAGRAA